MITGTWLKSKRESVSLGRKDMVRLLRESGTTVTEALYESWEAGEKRVPQEVEELVQVLFSEPARGSLDLQAMLETAARLGPSRHGTHPEQEVPTMPKTASAVIEFVYEQANRIRQLEQEIAALRERAEVTPQELAELRRKAERWERFRALTEEA